MGVAIAQELEHLLRAEWRRPIRVLWRWWGCDVSYTDIGIPKRLYTEGEWLPTCPEVDGCLVLELMDAFGPLTLPVHTIVSWRFLHHGEEESLSGV